MSLPPKPRRSLAEGEFLSEVDPEPLEETVTAHGGNHLNLPDRVFKIATPPMIGIDSILSPLTELGCKLLQPLQQARFEAPRHEMKRYHFASNGRVRVCTSLLVPRRNISSSET